MYLYLGNERVVVGEWIVDVISFQKIFGLCGLKCHIVEIWRDVTFVDVAATVFVYLYIFLSIWTAPIWTNSNWTDHQLD